MKPVIVWVLLVDKGHARILETRGPGTGLAQLPGHVYEAPETPSYSDDEGRAMAGMTGAKARNDKRIEHTPESIEFVRTIVERLTTEHQQGKFDHLVICAAPSMLGLMRQYLPEQLHTIVKRELAKDLVHIPTDDLPSHFEGILHL